MRRHQKLFGAVQSADLLIQFRRLHQRVDARHLAPVVRVQLTGCLLHILAIDQTAHTINQFLVLISIQNVYLSTASFPKNTFSRSSSTG